MTIVDKLLVKLEPVIAKTDLNPGKGWVFSRTHAKKNSEAVKWVLKSRARDEKRLLGSVHTVKDLLAYEAFAITEWEGYMLVTPVKALPKVLIEGLEPLERDMKGLIHSLKAETYKPRDALLKSMELIQQLIVTLKGTQHAAGAATESST